MVDDGSHPGRELPLWPIAVCWSGLVVAATGTGVQLVGTHVEHATAAGVPWLLVACPVPLIVVVGAGLGIRRDVLRSRRGAPVRVARRAEVSLSIAWAVVNAFGAIVAEPIARWLLLASAGILVVAAAIPLVVGDRGSGTGPPAG